MACFCEQVVYEIRLRFSMFLLFICNQQVYVSQFFYILYDRMMEICCHVTELAKAPVLQPGFSWNKQDWNNTVAYLLRQFYEYVLLLTSALNIYCRGVA
jgi:hypothetical protein